MIFEQLLVATKLLDVQVFHFAAPVSPPHGKYTLRIATDHCRLPLALPFTDGLYYLLFSQLSRCLYHFYLLYDK